MTNTKILVVSEFEKGTLLVAEKSEILLPNLCCLFWTKKDVKYVVCISCRSYLCFGINFQLLLHKFCRKMNCKDDIWKQIMPWLQ